MAIPFARPGERWRKWQTGEGGGGDEEGKWEGRMVGVVVELL